MDEFQLGDYDPVEDDDVVYPPPGFGQPPVIRKWVPTVLVMHRGRFAYVSMRKGVFLRRPYRVEKWICSAWNWAACRLTDHDRCLEYVTETYEDGLPVCPACCARYQPRPK